MSSSPASSRASSARSGRVVLELSGPIARELRKLGADTQGGINGAVTEWIETLTRRPAVMVRVCCQGCDLTMAFEMGSLEALDGELAIAPWRRWARADGTTLCDGCIERRRG